MTLPAACALKASDARTTTGLAGRGNDTMGLGCRRKTGPLVEEKAEIRHLRNLLGVAADGG